MDQAVAEYRALARSDRAWMVRRFICPVAWLSELLEQMPDSVLEPWPISVLGTSLDGYRQDMNAIERFEEAAHGRAIVECYEVKANRAELESAHLKALANAGFEEVFIEVPWGEEMLDALHQLVLVEGIGAKARTGGLEAAAFPSSEMLAKFIHEAISLDIPFKLTAGLHHPAPHHDEAIGARMHGFLNVLVGTTLALAHDLRRDELASILSEDDTNAFWYTDAGCGFRDWEASLDDVADGRSSFVSWGSCSVDEPCEDLAELGLLNERGGE